MQPQHDFSMDEEEAAQGMTLKEFVAALQGSICANFTLTLHRYWVMRAMCLIEVMPLS